MSGGQDPEFQTSVSLIIEIKILNVSAIYSYTTGIAGNYLCTSAPLYPIKVFYSCCTEIENVKEDVINYLRY